MINLVTFTSAEMTRSAELCESSARAHGADKAFVWHSWYLRQSEFYKDHKAILDEPRGAGLWAWKSHIILDALLRTNDGEFVCYSDAGVEFINNIRYITDRMTDDIWLFGNQWEHTHWCKRDIVEAIMPTVACGGCSGPYGSQQFGWCDECRMRRYVPTPWEAFGKQVQASVIVLRNSVGTRTFVKEWLHHCTNKHLIDDSPSLAPNHPEFRENRHDQAILTTLAYREGIPLHWWGAVYNDGAFTYSKEGYESDTYPAIFHHHRRRAADWEKAA